MPKFKLICDHSCDLDTHVVTHEFNAEHLDDVIMNIDSFLRGAGYVYNGELGICEETVSLGDTIKFDWGTDNTMNCSTTFTSDTITTTPGHSDFYYDINRNR